MLPGVKTSTDGLPFNGYAIGHSKIDHGHRRSVNVACNGYSRRGRLNCLHSPVRMVCNPRGTSQNANGFCVIATATPTLSRGHGRIFGATKEFLEATKEFLELQNVHRQSTNKSPKNTQGTAQGLSAQGQPRDNPRTRDKKARLRS